MNNGQTSTDIEAIMILRRERYGDFKDFADVAQDLKTVMHSTPNWTALTPAMREGLDMIQHKIARMLVGDPFYMDNIDDIVGYATCIKQTMEKAHARL